MSAASEPAAVPPLGRVARRVMELEHCLLLVRHAQTAYNIEDRLTTRSDIPLSQGGATQASGELADALAGAVFDSASSSPKRRAWATAQRGLSQASVLGELRADERLVEPDAGILEGCTFAELYAGPLAPVYAAYASESDPVYPDGAEHHEVSVARASALLAEALSRPGRHVAFSHGAFIRLLVCVFLDSNPCAYRRLRVDNCHSVLIKFWPQPPHQLVAFNLPPS